MKIIKKLSALLAAVVMCSSLAACHKAGAIAATCGEMEMTTGVYLAHFINADIEARNTVYDALSSAGKDVSNINYHSQKIGDKKYADWVDERTREMVRQFFWVEKTFNEMGLKIEGEDATTLKNQIDYYWSSAGYSLLMEPNGVSYDSYATYYTGQYKMNRIMVARYSEGGEKAISADDMSKGLTDNFLIADTISESLTDSSGNALSDDDKQKAKQKLESYLKRLEDGESFETIYNEHNKSEQSTDSSSVSGTTSSGTASTSSSVTASSESSSTATSSSAATSSATSSVASGSVAAEEKPEDQFATLYGSDKTGYASDYFVKLAELKVGERKIIEFDDCYMLAVKQDISADPYYTENLHDMVITVLKADEYEKDVKAVAAKLEVAFDSYEVNNFSVKKIEYPSY